MKRTLLPVFIIVATTALAGFVWAQPVGNVQPRRGVSVQLAVTNNAVSILKADEPDAVVAALTADGGVYLNATPVSAAELAATVQRLLSARGDKTLFIKADARVPYARLIEVIDSVRHTDVERVTLLTAQREAPGQGTRPGATHGLELRIR